MGKAWAVGLKSIADRQQSVKYYHQLPSRLYGQHEHWFLPKTDRGLFYWLYKQEAEEDDATELITAHFVAIECLEDIIAFLSLYKIVLLLLVVVTDLKEQRLES